MFSPLIDALSDLPVATKPIGSLTDNCCIPGGTTAVIDNTDLNNQLQTAYSEPIRLTLDGLFFPHTHTLIFFEFLPRGNRDYEIFEVELSDPTKIRDKFAGSIALLSRLVQEKGLETSYQNFHESIAAHPIKTFIISNISEEDYTRITLANGNYILDGTEYLIFHW